MRLMSDIVFFIHMYVNVVVVRKLFSIVTSLMPIVFCV
jgi:hypothetical protein